MGASAQHHAIPIYAELCAVLRDWCAEKRVGDSPESTFKRILLNTCQSFYEQHIRPPQSLRRLSEAKRKTAMLGSMRLLSSLIVKGLVGGSVLIAVADELLAGPVVPGSLESLAAFLASAGGSFDRSNWSRHKALERVFKEIECLAYASGT